MWPAHSRALELARYRAPNPPWETLTPTPPPSLRFPPRNTRSRRDESSDATDLAEAIQTLRAQIFKADSDAAIAATASHVYKYATRLQMPLKELMAMLDTSVARSMVMAYAPFADVLSYCSDLEADDHPCEIDCARFESFGPPFDKASRTLRTLNLYDYNNDVRTSRLFQYWKLCSSSYVRSVKLSNYTQPDLSVEAWLPELCGRLSQNTLSSVVVRDYYEAVRVGGLRDSLTDECIRAISSLRTSSLKLTHNAIAATPGLAMIATNALLTDLDLRDNYLQDAGVELLLSNAFEQLKTLVLSRNQLTDASIAIIQRALLEGRLPATISALLLSNYEIDFRMSGTPVYVQRWGPPQSFTNDNAFSRAAVEPFFRAMTSRPTWIILDLASRTTLVARGASTTDLSYLYEKGVALWRDTSSQSSS